MAGYDRVYNVSNELILVCIVTAIVPLTGESNKAGMVTYIVRARH